jgi:hypothetical protein
MTFRGASNEWPQAGDSAEHSFAGDDRDRPADYVSFHKVGARGVLFDSATQNLYLLNRLGGFIWCSLAEGLSPAAVAAELVRRSSSDSEEATAAVHAAIENWRTLGLTRGAQPATADAPIQPSRKQSGPPPLESRPVDSRIRICRVLGCDFAVQFWDGALEARALPLLEAHLVDISRGIAATLDVARGEGGTIAIRHDSDTMQVLPDERSLAPAVFASLMRLALVYSPTYPALHAATARAGDGVVLFAGASGCGKSTLMAGLLAAGHSVLGDDTVVLERDTMQVRPLTPYLCVKSGSWDALAARLPELAAAPEFVRADDARVRYLVADGFSPKGRADHAGAERVKAIVFPRYQAGAAPRLTRIAGFLALKELLPSLDPIGHDLTAADIDRLIGWMGETECYTLSYGLLDDAISALSGILA